MNAETNSPIRMMDWETEFFGFKVARLLAPRLGQKDLKFLLHGLKKQGVSMVAWPADGSDVVSHAAAEAEGGFLADRKVTYSADIQVVEKEGFELPEGVCVYEGSEATPELIDLGLQSSEFSRFRVDPRFPPERCDAMYRLWTEKCVRGELADRVLVVPDVNGHPRAMLAVGQSGDRGQVVLIGVDREHRGKGLGTRLMAGAQAYFEFLGLKQAQVVTQEANESSCRLYESCGFQVSGRDFFYHFWLD